VKGERGHKKSRAKVYEETQLMCIRGNETGAFYFLSEGKVDQA